VTAGDEADVRVGQLEATIEAGDHLVDLAPADLVAVSPAGRAAVERAGVEVNAQLGLIEAHQRDTARCASQAAGWEPTLATAVQLGPELPARHDRWAGKQDAQLRMAGTKARASLRPAARGACAVGSASPPDDH